VFVEDEVLAHHAHDCSTSCPLACTRCGQRLSLIAFVTDQVAIARILEARPRSGHDDVGRPRRPRGGLEH
jgi:hypothetical protein